MCGIIGYTGKLEAQNVLIDGLSRLEYRGYDSAGIAYFRENIAHISIRKTAGKVKDLRSVCDKVNPSTCGIGHTRWATHGGVSTTNAHPHRVGQVALIHNGIIENYAAITEKFNLGDELQSETDTEVGAALLNHFYSQDHDPKSAIRKAVAEIKGSFAFGILFEDRPGEIYAVRNVSPMVAAYDPEIGAFIASDVTAFIEHTNRYFVVPEYAVVALSPNGIEVEDLKGQKLTPEFMTVDWDLTAAEKDGYPHFMLKEIHEQPAAITRTITPRIADGLPDFAQDGVPDDFFEGVRDVTIIACGTAMYAGMVGAEFIQNHLGLPVTVSIASEFRYARPVIDKDSMVIVVSQSGETIDTLEALRLAKKYTDRTLSIVNVKASSIARESHYVVYTHAGPEIAVASTKAYTVQVATMFLLGFKLGLASGRLTEDEARDRVAALKAMPAHMEEVLAYENQVKELTSRMINAHDAFYIGRGLDYRVAMEGALKLKEISYIHAEAYAAGELKHGTISLIEKGVPVIAIANQQPVYEKMISNIREVKARDAFVILISKDKAVHDPSICNVHLSIPDVPDDFTVFETAVLCQLIGYYTSVGKGLDPDQPRNLAKSVTVE
ncbi:glutamine--fructose-6-phosphate transaminase (isomerizing) [Pseudoramibacter sp.]|jgi:glucosamine--fructose-6-phosphate aminotransferase (isomerizing)|uniref:glutamine--fructose-6-phosphate transaminase (isomerizing) n=1 Tax=Pseudoramibacter sp. TaxID=2034862 RepID=UPI0025E07EF3|nr:glutamine--fructose-6-phosphate transaminase (isomerizing) [Pseudoramibacter sp.]MCH4071989.1 glutamine--fructose-6-phosphate transaminase (isomerizing) [Pseudoramibacter sp.]MCH4105758.1 glutamine--fructose-6-phosphate transaminase (isomerizing) [Pseudoramibacter sp.]